MIQQTFCYNSFDLFVVCDTNIFNGISSYRVLILATLVAWISQLLARPFAEMLSLGLSLGFGKHHGDPHVSDRWCVTHGATKPLDSSLFIRYQTAFRHFAMELLHVFVHIPMTFWYRIPLAFECYTVCIALKSSHPKWGPPDQIQTRGIRYSQTRGIRYSQTRGIRYSQTLQVDCHTTQDCRPHPLGSCQLLSCPLRWATSFDVNSFDHSVEGDPGSHKGTWSNWAPLCTIFAIKRSPSIAISLAVVIRWGSSVSIGQHLGYPQDTDILCVIHGATNSWDNRPKTQHLTGHRQLAIETSGSFVDIYKQLGKTHHLQDLQHRPLPLRGVRIGEATNPGPESDDHLIVNFAITNPTSIVSKFPHYSKLTDSYNIHVHGVSETSATLIAQKSFQSKMKQLGMQSIWSKPVAAHTERLDRKESFRGKASGVALFSKFSMRMVASTVPEDLLTTSRIVHGIIYFGAFPIQVMQIYCLPKTVEGSSSFNNRLLTAAYQAIQEFPIPSIIMGDFNAEPDAFDICDHMAEVGYINLIDHFRHMYGTEMAATCRDVTRTDYAFLSHELRPFVRAIAVKNEKCFDTHEPVMFTVGLPATPLFRRKLIMPQSWISLDLDEEQFEELYLQQVLNYGSPSTIEEWGNRVENLIQASFIQKQVQQGICNPKPLPKKFLGRCQPPKVICFPQVELTHKSRPGDYHPPNEVHTMAAMKQTRQLRRIRSLLGLIRKYPTPASNLREQMQLEWQAICRSRAFGPIFTEWAQQQPEIGPLPRWIPYEDHLYDIYQIVKFHVDAKISRDHGIWTKKLKYSRHLDVSDQGAKQAFKAIKGPTKPMLTTLQHQVARQVILVPTDAPECFEAYGEAMDHFVTTDCAELDGKPVQVHEIHQDRLGLKISHELDTEREEYSLTQTQHVVNPSSICAHLTNYWHHYWTTDVHNPTTADTETFQALINSMPATTPIPIELHDVKLWMNGIRDFKAQSSPGIDGITPAELKQLPIPAIKDLMRILNSYPHGFPDWFMTARTCPIPKISQIPGAAQIRPITVMATLYRLWARVIGRQVLASLSTSLPPQVTGLLAHRGPKEAAYNMQAFIEQIHYSQLPAVGLSLDLEKCFNTIGRGIASQVLCHFGVPAPLVQQWMSSLGVMKRCWHLHNHFGPAIDTNTGVVEGDVWSVLVMVCLAALWTMQIQQISEDVSSTAYADNWGMLTKDVTQFATMLQCTQRFVALTGMRIDWNKSWWWASNKPSETFAQEALSTCNISGVPRVNSAKDLGSPMTYKGPCKLGSFRERLQEAHQRLKRVQSLPHDISTKTRLVATSVYPAAFYGSELVPLGSVHVNQLRPQIISAIYGESSSRNSALALHLTPKLLDPMVYLIYQTICAARYYLLTVSELQQTTFCNLVAGHSGKHVECLGPAGCLKYYIMKFGWQLTPEGQLHVDTFLSFDLRKCSKQRILAFCLRAWNEDLLQHQTDRKAWQNLLPIDRRATLQVLTKFGDQDRHILINEITGAFQTSAQKAKWDPTCPLTCPHCTSEDSREHRLHSCPAFSDIRQPFEEVLNFYTEQGMQIHELAVIFLSPWDTMKRTLQFQQPKPVWLDTVTDAFLLRVTQGLVQHYYTDGSCQFPTLIDSRFASYSIVADLCENDASRQHAVNTAPASGDRPTLQTLAAARCQGEQNIHRAELQAIVELCHVLPPGTVHTDSQVALTVAQQCQTQPLLSLHNLDNFDLIGRLWNTLQTKSFQFSKVAAHCDFHETEDKNMAYHQMGNQVANDRAIWACWHLQREMIQEWIQHCQWVEEQQQYLEKIFHFHVQLFKARINLFSIQQQEEQHARHQTTPNILETFCTWTVANRWQPEAPRMDLTGESTWGPFVATKFKEWHDLIQWPSDEEGPDDYGVTWYELSLSFMLHLGGFLPIKTTGTDGTERLMVCNSYADAFARGLRMADFCTNFNQLYLQMADLTKPSLMPNIDRGLVRSLYLLGAGFQASGYRRRPCYPSQDTVCRLLHSALRQHRGTQFGFLLDLPFTDRLLWTPALTQTFAGSWSSRSNRAQRAMRRLRASDISNVGHFVSRSL